MAKPSTVASISILSNVNNNVIFTTAGTKAAPSLKIKNWTLDFGDKSNTNGTGAPPATIPHTYAPGPYTAVFTVTDTKNVVKTSSVSFIVTVVIVPDPPPPPPPPPPSPDTRGPLASPTIPGSPVDIATTDNIQTKINANPINTVFKLKTGTHTVSDTITPKLGQQFWGEDDATIIDGTGWSSVDVDAAPFQGPNNGVTGVVVSNLIIRVLPSYAVNCFGTATGWLIDHCTIHHTRTGVGLSANTICRNSIIHDCVGNTGDPIASLRGGGYIAAPLTAGVVVDGIQFINNEVYACGTEQKFGIVTNLMCNNCYFHDNVGNGFWIDGRGDNSIIENNVSNDNGENGIVVENGTYVTIRNNTVNTNTFSGIYLTISRNNQVYNNTLTNNNVNFDLFLDCNSLGQETWNPDLTNNDIYNNINISTATSKVASSLTFPSGGSYCSANYYSNAAKNIFRTNTYTLGTGNRFTWNGNKTIAQWQAIPQDVASSFTLV